MGASIPADDKAVASGIDTEMYLRDGAPHATVCRVVMKDGRVGIGIYRAPPRAPGAMITQFQTDFDQHARDDALANLHAFADDLPPAEQPDHDLQESIGQKAHE